MSLQSGSRLGAYEIAGRLGSGGMGEVYRARDTRLGREVALKILPAEFAADPVRRARFEQEARATAALNHPNILNLHDVGDENGLSYIVTELVVGETLTAVIQRGPVPLKKLLDIATQIADGIASAHAAGITHRDLKPGNIMVTGDGRVKVLDFGLARHAAKAAAAGQSGETETVGRTDPGMVMGTVAYMSPEQARGKPLDHRSDQFSFGLILYEMAAGKRAFDRPESVQVMSAIVTEEAPPIERSLPAPLHWVIDRCLSKDAADRYESTGDLYRELRGLRDHLSEATSTPAIPAGTRGRRRGVVTATAASVLSMFMFAIGAYLASSDVPDQSHYRFTPFAIDPKGQDDPCWSPDGRSIAYAARTDSGLTQVFVRQLDAPTALQVTQTRENATPIGWMPDGLRIVFVSREPQDVVISLRSLNVRPTGIWSVAAVGGEPQSLLPIAQGTAFAFAYSPNGKSLAVFRRGDDKQWGVWTSSPVGSPLEAYSPSPFASSAVYDVPALRFSPQGDSILLLRTGTEGRQEAWLLPYPPKSSSPPRQVLRDLQYFSSPTFAWMPDSHHVVLSMRPMGYDSVQPWRVDLRSGHRELLTSGTSDRVRPSVSRDSHALAFTELARDFNVVSAGLDGTPPRPVIDTERAESMPAWAANRPVLAYVTDRNGPPEVWLRLGESDRRVAGPSDFPPNTAGFMGPIPSPGGDRVAYTRLRSKGPARIWISHVSGGAPTPLTEDQSSEYPGSWSPDGNWFTYVRVNRGMGELMKVKTSGQATPIMLKSSVVAWVPSWSPTGEWIAHGDELISPDAKTMRSLGNHGSLHYMFSSNGKLVYGIRPDGPRNLLFSVKVASGVEKLVGDLGADARPASPSSPGIRFSLAPDGKSFVYGVVVEKSNIWLMQGFDQRLGLLSRLGFDWLPGRRDHPE